MLQSFDGVAPSVHESAYVHPDATLVGDVTLEADASVWPGAVLRGDRGPIIIREGTNVQDNAVCHEEAMVGPHATVGHAAVVHHCDVGEHALVGINAVVLDGATVGDGATVAAGSVVAMDDEVPPRSLVAGVPASVVREDVGETGWEQAAAEYADLARQYRETSTDVEE